jgi:hypothetical protein
MKRDFHTEEWRKRREAMEKRSEKTKVEIVLIVRDC